MPLVFALFVAAFAPALIAQQKTQEQTYVITLKPAVASASDVAADFARLYGGIAERQPAETDGAFRMRLTRSRARVIASDPRVASITTLAALQPNAITEAVNWSGGISYTYDGTGNVRKIGNDAFGYDHAGRLISANVNGTPRNYSYDAFGNRTGCQQWAGTSQQAECQKGKTINADENRNRIKEAGYDDAGNVTSMDGHQYAYDAVNVMKRDSVGTQAREFVYTANDERIAVYNVGSSWRWTIRDLRGKVLREFTSSNGPNGVGTASWQWTRDNVFRDTLLLASRQPENLSTTTYFYHLDHLGSSRRVTDTSDRVIGSHDYFAFGPEISGGTNEPSPGALKYTGHERDSWGGLFGTLDYMHSRYYDPELGRFLAVDPAKDWDSATAQSWSLYVYARNNPFSFYDPDGLKARLYTYIGFTNPGPKSELPTAKTIRKELKTELGGRIVNFRQQVNPNINPADFRTGLTDTEGIMMFIGHAFTPGPGLKFDEARADWLQNLTNNNSVILLGGCNTAGYAHLFGITPETTGKAFVGFAGAVNSMVLAEMTAMVVKGMESGKSIGDAVAAVRQELARRGVKPEHFRVVLVGDPNVTVTDEELKTSAPTVDPRTGSSPP